MTDVKRWVDDGASEQVRKLLTAAREERPAEAGVQRTLVALGVGSAVATGASHAAGGAGAATLAKGATGASTLAILTKWGVVGAIGAATTIGAVGIAEHSFERRSMSSPAPASVVKRQSVPAARATEPGAPGEALVTEPVAPSEPPAADQVAESPHAAAPKPAVNVPTDRATPAQVAATTSERILEEVRAIDRARSALARGDGRGTLSALDSYRDGFSERRFEPEALYLRMEALGQLGDRAGARVVATRLLSAFPNAPQAARARVVASEP